MIWLRRSCGGASGSVTAITIANAAPSAPELNHLCALITHASPVRSARARRPRGSDPETSGSVIAKNERISPATSGRSQRAFCSGVPNSWRISALPVSGAWQPKMRGATGLGRQMAPALGEMGADVVLCARNAERCAQTAAELSALGVRALGLRCDVTSAEDVRAMVERAKAELGRVDILVNNAGRAWV